MLDSLCFLDIAAIYRAAVPKLFGLRTLLLRNIFREPSGGLANK